MTEIRRVRKGLVPRNLYRQFALPNCNGCPVGKLGCVAIVRNEERHIAEWLVWQFLVGFDSVILFDNASTDATAAIARALSPRLDVRVFDYPNSQPDFQVAAYRLAVNAGRAEFAWLAFFDTDEFLCLDPGLSLRARLAARPEAAIAIPWAMFGAAGHREVPPGLIIEAFTRRAPDDFPPNRHIKSIVRPARVRDCLNPHAFTVDGAYVDLCGQPVTWQYFPGYLDAPPRYAGGRLHHYFTRSWAHWQARLARGHPAIIRTEAEFHENDRNEIADERAARHAPKIRRLLAGGPLARLRFIIVACARWEQDFIVEWLNYHRAIGFSHVFLYGNDDDPAPLFERLLPFTQGSDPFVTLRHHPRQGEQFEMYAHALRHALPAGDWVAFLDIDEFLRLPPRETIGQFTARFPGHIDCILFNWVFFGPNGHATAPPGNVLANFTRRDAELHPFTKYVAKTARVREISLGDHHRAHGFWHEIGTKLDFPVNTVNALGEDMRDYYVRFGAARSFVNEPKRRERLLETAVIHHYAFRGEDAFRTRSARGLAGDFAEQTLWRDIADGPYFQDYLRGFNAVEDDRLAQFWRAYCDRAGKQALLF